MDLTLILSQYLSGDFRDYDPIVALPTAKTWAAPSPSHAIIDEVWQIINREYFDTTFNGTNWEAIRSEYLKRDYISKEEAYKATQEMLKKLQDPYTRFMDPEQFKSMQVGTSRELGSIGIQFKQDKKDKGITIISSIKGSPAAEVGLLFEDVIVSVNDQSTKEMDINDVRSLLQGPVNTDVSLTVLRDKEKLNFTMKRDHIKIDPVRFAYQKTSTGGVGYIQLNRFSSNASAEMREAIQALSKKNVAGFILDLRSNPGGLLYSSAEIARMWMSKGTILSTIDRNGETNKLTSSEKYLNG